MRKVDHDLRRREVAKAAAELIAAKGLDKLTTRALAKHMGCSIGVLSHYFNSKEDIGRAAFEWADERIDQRVQAAVAEQGADLDSFIPILLAALPFDKASDLEWKVRFNLFTCAFTEPALLDMQRSKIKQFEDLMTAVVKEMQADGNLRKDFAARYMTQVAFDIVMGLAQNLLMLPIEQREQRAEYMMHLFAPLQGGGRLRIVPDEEHRPVSSALK